MIISEKVDLLKSINLFQYVPDELLEQVANSLKEREYSMGDIILQKDEIGHDMFIIVNGRVRVHDNNMLIKELGDGDFFGELAALSFSRRVASVSALTDVMVLKISSASLYELMSSDIGLAKGMIKAFCERMEEMAIQSQTDKKQIELAKKEKR